MAPGEMPMVIYGIPVCRLEGRRFPQLVGKHHVGVYCVGEGAASRQMRSVLTVIIFEQIVDSENLLLRGTHKQKRPARNENLLEREGGRERDRLEQRDAVEMLW